MFKIVFLLLALFLSCSSPKASFTDEQKLKLENILVENQKVLSFLLSSDTGIPNLTDLIGAIKTAQSSVPDGSGSELLKDSLKILESTNKEDRESTLKSLSQFSEKAALLAQTAELKSYNKFYCPMVEKFWVAKGEKIENPYAPDMRECGELIK